METLSSGDAVFTKLDTKINTAPIQYQKEPWHWVSKIWISATELNSNVARQNTTESWKNQSRRSCVLSYKDLLPYLAMGIMWRVKLPPSLRRINQSGIICRSNGASNSFQYRQQKKGVACMYLASFQQINCPEHLSDHLVAIDLLFLYPVTVQ